jgi:hypothetical protein
MGGRAGGAVDDCGLLAGAGGGRSAALTTSMRYGSELPAKHELGLGALEQAAYHRLY